MNPKTESVGGDVAKIETEAKKDVADKNVGKQAREQVVVKDVFF